MPGTILKQLVTTPQTSGTTVTTGNSGWSSLSVGTGNTHTHDDAAKMGQPAGYRILQGGTGNQNFAYLDLASPVAVFAGRFPFEFGASPAAGVNPTIGRFYPDTAHTTNLGSILITNTLKVQFVEGGTGGLNVTSTGSVVSGTAYVGQVLFNCTTNTLTINVYQQGSASVTASVSGTLAADGAAATGVGSIRWGIATNSSGLSTLDTNSAFALGSGDFLDRHDVSTALASQTALSTTNAQVGVQISATVTHTGGNGNAVSYDVAWGDGTTSGPSSSGSFTHTYSAAGTYTVTGAAEQAN